TYQVPFSRAGRVSQANDVRLQVFDFLGREVAVLVSGEQVAGRHAIRWEARSHPSGIYFCRLAVGGNTQTIRMVLLR
ncbi:MAG: T9SS type A sorting domain-containing protein, partial [Bacteroidetes bacterium]|nr:T9SS type A sorting domain-containing protein [Bacteroidota bacterium]